MPQDLVVDSSEIRANLGQYQIASRTPLAVTKGAEAAIKQRNGNWDERLCGESAKAHQALMDYAEAGPSRSLRSLLARYLQIPRDTTAPQPPARSLATLSAWSSKFEWRRRSHQYDDEQQTLRSAQMRQLRFHRQEQIAEEDWAVSLKLRKMSLELLNDASKFLNVTVIRTPAPQDKNGNFTGPERVTQTIGLNTRDVLAAVKLSSELGRLATGMPTANRRHDLDFSRMSDTQLLEFLAQNLSCEIQSDAADKSMVEITGSF